ncbi:MAG: helix-turn-helix domain-containing protein, partial [Desulfobacula sp.]|nr:helix-turn-helix domain-containing protein [Desulfobacula sp.]
RSNEISKKERQVLQLVAEGERTRDIAEKLGVSIKTIETHRRNIMKKLSIFSIAGLTKFAILKGLVVTQTYFNNFIAKIRVFPD